MLHSVGVFQHEEHREQDEDGPLIRAHWKDDPPSFNKNWGPYETTTETATVERQKSNRFHQ